MLADKTLYETTHIEQYCTQSHTIGDAIDIAVRRNRKTSTNATDDEQDQKNKGNEPAWVKTQELRKNNRTSAQKNPIALKRSRSDQTDVLSCLMGAQGKEKQHLCMNTHDEYEKIAAMIDSGATVTVVLVEKFESYPIEQATTSCTTYSSAAGKQEEEIVNVVAKVL